MSVISPVETGIDQSVKVLVTPNNRYHLGCSGTKSGNFQPVYYFYSDTAGTTWTANHPSGPLAHNVTVGPGANGGLRLWFHTNAFAPTNVNILYVEGTGGSGAWGAVQTFATGALDCSVNTRWAQYHHAWPTRLDVAYWGAAYPNALYLGSASKTSPIAALTGTVGVSGSVRQQDTNAR